MNEVDPQQVKEVYARFGLAMYHAQCLERQVAILVAACCNPEFLRKPADERKAIFDAEMAKTLGILVRRLSDQVRIGPNLQSRITKALKTRNWLAHNYFWERSAQFLGASGREDMIRELTGTSNELSALDELLTADSIRWCKRVGITDDMIEAALDNLRAESGA